MFLWRWNRYISVEFSVVYLLMPIINVGYLRIAVAENLPEAVLANGLVYLCTCYLQLGYLVYICKFCKITIPRLAAAPLFVLSALIGSTALTATHNGLIYSSVDFVPMDKGMPGYLVKEYGPLHTVYYMLLGFYLLAELAALIYGFRRKDVSKRNALLLFALYFVNLSGFLLGRALSLPVELLPMTYVLTQVLLLVMSGRLKMYSITDVAVSTAMQEERTGFASFDHKRRFLGCNPPAAEYFPEFDRIYVDKQLPENEPSTALIKGWLDAMDSSEGSAELELERDGINYKITVSPIDSGRKHKGYQIRIDDKTEEYRYIRLLKQARESAEAVSRAKGDFLANMSHEIRTPINAILGMDEMILRESSDEQTLEYAEDIRKAGNTLLGLINDVLDFSKIEAGKTEIIEVDYQFSSVLNDLSNMIEPRARDKGLELIVRAEPDIPDYLHGDEIRVKQIITNILTNAVKYTKEGSVTLSVTHKKGDGYTDLTVRVTDTGIGIRKDDIDKLFIAFERIDENRNRSIEGTGLGLSIVQSLLTLMGSRLEIESEYGKGSTFGFTLRQTIVKDTPIGDYSQALERSVAARRKYYESFCAPGAKILVVDDTEMNIMVFRSLLKNTQMQIESATSGDEAIQLCRKIRYDILFLDHRMPVKDGLETLAEIISDPDGLNRDTPAVCLTANAVSGVREQYIAAGFTEYLTKPIDPMRLEAMTVELLPPELVLPPIGAPTPTDDFDKDGVMEIYLADIENMSSAIEQCFNSADWENYTIKVHALKSTSRLVGETRIADLAAKLEQAGDSRDLAFIRENTPELLSMYRGVLVRYGFASPEPPADRPLASPEQLSALYSELRTASENFDFDAVCDIADRLDSFSIPPEHADKVSALLYAAEQVDWGKLKALTALDE